MTVCTVMDFAPGDIVSVSESIALCAHILMSGRMTIVDPLFLKTLSPQEMNDRLRDGAAVLAADVECLLLDNPTVAERSVWALDYSEVLVIDKADFLDLRRSHPTIDQHIRMLQNSSRGLAIREKCQMRGALVEDSSPLKKKRPRRIRDMFGSNEENETQEATGAAIMSG